MEIPTRQFRVEGIKGKFSVSRKAKQIITSEGLKLKYEAFWNGPKHLFKFLYAFSREEALITLVGQIRQIEEARS